jgi:hypothetical protein
MSAGDHLKYFKLKVVENIQIIIHISGFTFKE